MIDKTVPLLHAPKNKIPTAGPVHMTTAAVAATETLLGNCAQAQNTIPTIMSTKPTVAIDIHNVCARSNKPVGGCRVRNGPTCSRCGSVVNIGMLMGV